MLESDSWDSTLTKLSSELNYCRKCPCAQPLFTSFIASPMKLAIEVIAFITCSSSITLTQDASWCCAEWYCLFHTTVRLRLNNDPAYFASHGCGSIGVETSCWTLSLISVLSFKGIALVGKLAAAVLQLFRYVVFTIVHTTMRCSWYAPILEDQLHDRTHFPKCNHKEVAISNGRFQQVTWQDSRCTNGCYRNKKISLCLAKCFR